MYNPYYRRKGWHDGVLVFSQPVFDVRFYPFWDGFKRSSCFAYESIFEMQLGTLLPHYFQRVWHYLACRGASVVCPYLLSVDCLPPSVREPPPVKAKSSFSCGEPLPSAGSVCCPVYRVVMHNDKLSVLCYLYICFNHIRA